MFSRSAGILSPILVIALSISLQAQEKTSSPSDSTEAKKQARIQKAIVNLGSPSFAVREEAVTELKEIGIDAIPALQQAIENSTDRETRIRAKLLIPKLQRGYVIKMTRQAKKATALMPAPNGRSRGGFGNQPQAPQPQAQPEGGTFLPTLCVHASGLFVAPDVRASVGTRLDLILYPGTGQQKKVQADVILTQSSLGLALLQTTTDIKYPVVELGEEKEITELQDLALLSYSAQEQELSKFLQPDNSHLGHVRALRKESDRLEGFYFDTKAPAELQQRLVGPVVNKQGKLLGLGAMGSLSSRGFRTSSRPTFTNVVIPVNYVKEMLAIPVIRLTTPELKADELHKEVEFRASVLQLGSTTAPMKVELMLFDGTASRTVAMTEDKGVWKAKVIPVPPKKAKPKCQATFRFDNGELNAAVEDQNFTFGRENINLSQIYQFQRQGDKAVLVLHSGVQLTVPVKEWKDLTVVLGGATRKISVSEIQSMVIQPPARQPAISCVARALSEGRELNRIAVTLPLPVPVPEQP